MRGCLEQHAGGFPLEDAVAEAVCLYLFEGIRVKRIEERLFGAQEFREDLAKILLNFYRISTENGISNRELYKKESLQSGCRNSSEKS